MNRKAGVDEVVEHLLSLTPNGHWVQDNGQDVHLIITGGESLLAWQKLYVELFEHERMKDLKNVTFETNTTQHLHETLEIIPIIKTGLQSLGLVVQATLVESPGQTLLSPMWLLIIAVLMAVTICILKFVFADRTDIEEAGRAVEEYPMQVWNVRVSMPWVADQKSTTSMYKKLLTSAWKKDGDPTSRLHNVYS